MTGKVEFRSDSSQSKSLGASLKEESDKKSGDKLNSFRSCQASGGTDILYNEVFVSTSLAEAVACKKYLDITSSPAVTPGKSLVFKNPRPTDLRQWGEEDEDFVLPWSSVESLIAEWAYSFAGLGAQRGYPVDVRSKRGFFPAYAFFSGVISFCFPLFFFQPSIWQAQKVARQQGG
jgi:hypothetical protein